MSDDKVIKLRCPGPGSPDDDERWQTLADLAYAMDGEPQNETTYLAAALDVFGNSDDRTDDFAGYAVHRLLTSLQRNRSWLLSQLTPDGSVIVDRIAIVDGEEIPL